VQQDDVAWRKYRKERIRVRTSNVLVLVTLPLPQPAPIPGRTVETVVYSLRDREEILASLDHEPARIDPRSARIRQKCLQHLGDTTADRGRIDVQNRSISECHARGFRDRLEPAHALNSDERLKAGGIERLDLDFL
jgi:hypothetical protein